MDLKKKSVYSINTMDFGISVAFKFEVCKNMSENEKVSTFARSVMKLARYAHRSAVPMIDGLEKSQKSERRAVLVIG